MRKVYGLRNSVGHVFLERSLNSHMMLREHRLSSLLRFVPLQSDLCAGIQNAKYQIMNTSKYAPNLSRGTRVRLIGHHRKNDQQCTIIDALPNPSKRLENQWYDVRFDDHTTGRFLERYLVPVAAERDKPAA
jgi:hypothetical protein